MNEWSGCSGEGRWVTARVELAAKLGQSWQSRDFSGNHFCIDVISKASKNISLLSTCYRDKQNTSICSCSIGTTMQPAFNHLLKEHATIGKLEAQYSTGQTSFTSWWAALRDLQLVWVRDDEALMSSSSPRCVLILRLPPQACRRRAHFTPILLSDCCQRALLSATGPFLGAQLATHPAPALPIRWARLPGHFVRPASYVSKRAEHRIR